MTNQHSRDQGPSYTGAPKYERPVYQPPQYQGAPPYQAGPNGSAHYPAHGSGQYNQPYQDPYSPPPARAKGSPPLWVGILVTCLGPVLGVIGIVLSFVFGVQQLDREMREAQPGSVHELSADVTHTLYAPSGDAISAAGCSIYGPDFEAITLTGTSSPTELSRDGESYVEVGEFTTTSSGTYRTTCPGSSDLVAIEGNGYLTLGLGVIGSLLIGGITCVIGIVLIIVNRVTASRRRQSYWPQR
ncbi:hypothetical protein FCK90_07670 [Kocuria coralli]|uniref:Uncharacterized protein n=1 Tax=Kocuria coralli TaxID=1461025 RepID=A0A5J5L045_9MICC|nr:hypothetical protein [Kocuria coralli]KAA9394341.1 hypothetical protein FCK90_07670 [Kocuria coralli]